MPKAEDGETRGLTQKPPADGGDNLPQVVPYPGSSLPGRDSLSGRWVRSCEQVRLAVFLARISRTVLCLRLLGSLAGAAGVRFGKHTAIIVF